MHSESQSQLDPADAALVETFARTIGVSASTLILLTSQALAAHIRSHGTLSLPVRIGLPSHLCMHCPLTKSLQQPAPAEASNILTGPWSA